MESSISRIMQSKEDYKRIQEQNGNLSMYRRKRHRDESHEMLDSRLMTWLAEARNRKVPISSPFLQVTARQIAGALNLEKFQASNGWLQAFRKRHNIDTMLLCGESCDMDISQTANENILAYDTEEDKNWQKRIINGGESDDEINLVEKEKGTFTVPAVSDIRTH